MSIENSSIETLLLMSQSKVSSRQPIYMFIADDTSEHVSHIHCFAFKGHKIIGMEVSALVI